MAKKESGRARIEREAEQLAAPVAEKHGVWIYDVEYVKEGADYYLNIYIDKDEGVNILDCEAVSRELSDRLDEADLISEAYTLVVSSPGLGRTLTKDRHLENSLGEKVEGKLYKPSETIGGKEFEGILTAWDAETITIETEPDKTLKSRGKKKKTEQEDTVSDNAARSITLPRKDIAVLRLYLEL
jgi:ribosome maturation factor RimP